MVRIPESELILTDDGRVYHLNLLPEMVADTIIVVGDPDRVPKVSRYFDQVEHRVNSRELVTHTGSISGTRLSVMSSGMGTDNVELLMTELDALVNVNLKTRMVNKELKELRIIRIGTSGCLQEDIPIDAHLVSEAALGLDTLMSFYDWKSNERINEFLASLRNQLDLNFDPYLAEASSELLALFQTDFHRGVTITAPGFYAPQGRQVRLKPRIDGMVDKLAQMETPFGRFTNLEMETAGYYAMAKLLGHQMISLNALIANRPRQEFSENHEAAVDRLIQRVIERLI
ncbi:nucleoside phosphorylase [Roseivirga misakiensis]|uniref:Uridine phosphorylase n=1 Tax=Roseivirga misakiensis TaxID=1563681 RepID=A0A1E5SY92_9BACT|nr:nucleoside phosphorylase [Roseivirga misakiensis]OEK04098.1 phosphorylase [Roseivirga misakiensis]